MQDTSGETPSPASSPTPAVSVIEIKSKPISDVLPVDPAVRQRAEAQGDAFVGSLGLSAADRAAATAVATNVLAMADTLVRLPTLGVSADDAAGHYRLASLGLAIACKWAVLRTEIAVHLCPCPECDAKRRRKAGWRGWLHRKASAFVAAWNA
jgi:hypothetical protein